MCDPVSIGLMAVGTAASMYGQSRVAGAQKKDIAKAGEKYQAERTKQAGFTAENEQTVGKTQDMYGRPAQDAASADAIASRTSAYTNPLQVRNFNAEMPADFDPNNVIAARNSKTADVTKAGSISEAIAKAKLDAYGDVQTKNLIGSNDNAQAIDMVRRISQGSARAANQQQEVLPTALKADENAGATWSGIGDVLKAAGMVTGMAGGVGNFSNSIPGVSPEVMAARYGNSVQGTGLLGGIQNAYNGVAPFGSTIGNVPFSTANMGSTIMPKASNLVSSAFVPAAYRLPVYSGKIASPFG